MPSSMSDLRMEADEFLLAKADRKRDEVYVIST